VIKVNEKEKYAYMFESYTHSIPIIYSSIEGQYDGDLYVDQLENPQIAVLFTPFAFHYVAGNADTEDVVEKIDDFIFKKYLCRFHQKEAIVFSPNLNWNHVLDAVFKRYNGIINMRNMFRLNKDKFMNRLSQHISPRDVDRKIVQEKKEGSRIEYPTCQLYLDQECISFCSGFMLGNGHAEINIETLEAYRGKGYGKDVAFALINTLIKKGIEPDWCTWPFRKASSKLAESIGFELEYQIPAYIWVEDECGKISCQ